jgi:hypothetical protein
MNANGSTNTRISARRLQHLDARLPRSANIQKRLNSIRFSSRYNSIDITDQLVVIKMRVRIDQPHRPSLP